MAGTAAQVIKTFDNKFSDLLLEQFQYKIYDLANIDILSFISCLNIDGFVQEQIFVFNDCILYVQLYTCEELSTVLGYL